MKKIGSTVSSSLVKLGFSPDEGRVYETLIGEGPFDAKSLARKVNVLPNALYRLLDKLIDKELVSVSGSHPKIYRAIPPSFAFDSLIKRKMTEFETIKETVVNKLTQVKTSDQTRIDLIKSQYEFFLTYAQLAKEAQQEILIISIGEAVPEEVILANRDALERGVQIRFIAHKYDTNNKNMLKGWKKMGLEVRYYPDWGFHLVVFDKTKSILSVNNPEKTNERIALIIYSKGLAKVHADYFNSVWEKAREIE